jgi:hypothetical protein
MIGV